MTAKTPSESAPAQSATPLSAVGLSGTGRSIVQPVRIELSVRTAQNQEHLHWVREAGQGPVMHSIRPNSNSSITSAADALWNAMNVTANTQASMSLAGLQDGTYRLYTADAAGNLSSATSNTLLVSSSTTPLVLDLNGDGVRTTDMAHGVLFDVNHTGSLVQTGWVDAHDGLLVLDLNRDGTIQNGSELFGSGTTLASTSGKATDGYEALRQYDLNHDSVIDAQDVVFKDLQVWQDSNTNGVSDAGELHSLASLGIASLDLNAVAGKQVDNGNTLGLVSGWTDTWGQTHQMADVWFNTTSPADLASQAAAHQVIEQNAKVFAC